MPTDNKAIVRRMNEAVWNEGNLEVIDEYFADDYVGHNPATPDETCGPEGFREYVQAARSAFPDLEVTTEDLVAEGDRVCRRTRTTGTHEGSFMGIEATGNAVDVSGNDYLSVRSWPNRRIVGAERYDGDDGAAGARMITGDIPTTSTRCPVPAVQRLTRNAG